VIFFNVCRGEAIPSSDPSRVGDQAAALAIVKGEFSSWIGVSISQTSGENFGAKSLGQLR